MANESDGKMNDREQLFILYDARAWGDNGTDDASVLSTARTSPAVTPEIVGRFQFAEIHGMKYEGPTYEKELQMLRDLAGVESLSPDARD